MKRITKNEALQILDKNGITLIEGPLGEALKMAYEALKVQAEREELPYDAMGNYSRTPQYTTPDEWYRDNFIRREHDGHK